jgi:hypothetical protein
MKSDRKLELLACRVAGGSTIKAAAKEIGMSEAAAYAITSSVEFKRRCTEIRSEATYRAVGLLSAGAAQAVATLVELLGVANDPSIRLNASKAILGLVGPLSELGELRSRLDEIESQSHPLKVAK